MERDTKQFLLPFVNKKENMDSVRFYALYRIQYLQKELEAADLSQVTCLQGQIKELRRIMKLDEIVRTPE